MMNLPLFTRLCVITLTLVSLFFVQACSVARQVKQLAIDPCKNHAYTQMVLEDYLSRRFHSKSPVRIGIVPFSVPANFASSGSEAPGFDYEIARSVQQQLLAADIIPIVEMFNRLDWPGKKDEFFTGNHGAIAFARQAGFDLVLVGYVPAPSESQNLSAFVKVIEVESEITVYYGKSEVIMDHPEYKRGGYWWWLGEQRPDLIRFKELTDRLSGCVTRGVLSEEADFK